MRAAPLIACVGIDVARTDAWVETVKSAGLSGRAFRSASAAIHHAAPMRFDAVVADWSIGKVDAAFLAQRLRVALGSGAPPVVVVSDVLPPPAARFAAIVPRGAPEQALLDAVRRVLATTGRAVRAS